MKWTPGTIERKIIWDEGLFTLVVRAPEVEPFEPGQFLQLGMETESGHLHRPYSVASPHGETLDFFIVLVPEGRLTPKLWTLEPGDALDVSAKAAGSFTLSKAPEQEVLWLVATGTGLAPYIAMLRTEEPWARYKKILLVHGVRYERDLAYMEELSQLKAVRRDQFEFVPVVSREESQIALKGRITTCIENGTVEQMAGAEFSTNSAVMLCGNPDMLNDVEAMLFARGLALHKAKAPGNIIAERYW